MDHSNKNNKREDVFMDVGQSTSEAVLDKGDKNAFSVFQRNRSNSSPSSGSRQTAMERLGSKIEELLEYIKDRNNVHGEIRKLARSIDTAYNLALRNHTVATKKDPSRTAKTTQTSPRITQQAGVLQTPNSTLRESNPKKRQLPTPSPTSGQEHQPSKKQAQGTWAEVTRRRPKRTKVPQDPAVAPKKAQEPQSSEGLRNSLRRAKRKKPRTKAVLVQPTEGRTYADLLKEIKTKVNPAEAGVDIKSIKQTRLGGVLLEISPKSEDSAAFAAAIRTATVNIGTVKTMTPLTTIEILDLDGVTTETDVREALERDFTTNMEIKRINLTRATSRGQRAAFCEIDVASATKALDKARLKIGWVNCRIRPVVNLTRCFRCLGYGHQTRNCTGPDRSKCCYKCGGENHKSIDCVEIPKCFLCTPNKDDKDGLCHIAGSGACKVFRTALAEATSRQK